MFLIVYFLQICIFLLIFDISESIQIIVLTLKKSRKIFSLTLFPIPDLRVVIVAAIIAAMEVMDSVPRKIIQHSETAAVLVKKGFFNNKSIKKN